MKSFLRRYYRLGALFSTLFLLLAVTNGLFSGFYNDFYSGAHSGAAIAQPTPIRRVNPTAVSTQIYQQLPGLPLENQYISEETGTAASDNTLVSRLIRYHIYIKNRPTVFRLDWKLTVADYLGAFERIAADSYLDYGLRSNPYERDLAAMASLSPAQRDELVNALYAAFTTTPQSAELSNPTDATETGSTGTDSTGTDSTNP